ncbi:MAG TPA: hypothetical protein VKB23_11585 [Solirubrobacterales bacterium]|nr:hypothetical protein [Solirubrobacterales bacterium]
MKYVKMLGLLALAATALFAFAASASATTLTSPKGTQYTGTLHAVTEGHAILHDTSGLGITIQCNGTVHGTVTAGGAGITPEFHFTQPPNTGLNWSNCTDNWHVTTLKTGTLQIHNIAGSENGTVTSLGAEVTTKQSTTGLHCIYSTAAAGTDVGTLTSSTVTGGESTLDIAATITRTGGSSGFFCGSAGTWTGNYKVTTPATGYVDA